MTLVETMIAISLLSMVLMVAFGFFRELSHLSLLMEKQQKDTFQMRYVESRLFFIFSRVVNENLPKMRPFFFYTQPPQKFSEFKSLILTFDNGVRIDPHFSGDILARLYLDTDHRLHLAMWPLRIPQPHQFMQEEILLDNVVGINLEFYASPEKKMSSKAIGGKSATLKEGQTQPERDQWHTEWLLTHKQMPSLIKLSLEVAKNPAALLPQNKGMKVETEQFVYRFVLPSSQNPVYYPPD